MPLTSKEEQYLNAKDAYYAGEPIMSDPDFDKLENELKSIGSSVINRVGGKVKGNKYDHWSTMLSLDKVQVDQTGDSGSMVFEIERWANKNNFKNLELTPKYDGNAINIQYKNGKFYKALTRGDGVQGHDVSAKVRHLVPDTIPIKDETFEVRGEIIIPITTFTNKYLELDYANPRNFVAGILNSDSVNIDTVYDLVFMAYDILIDEDDNDFKKMELLSSLGFNKKLPVYTLTIKTSELRAAYDVMLKYRQNADVQLDGIVVKGPERLRSIVGETSHHPKWAKAIKFPAEDAISEIISIDITIGKTGQLIPTAILKPTPLDGTTVKRASLYNFEYVISNKAFPGATVKIRKAGDIIPQIIQIIKPSSSDYIKPTEWDGKEVYWDGPHLKVKGWENIAEVVVRKINNGLNVIGVKNIGPATIEHLRKAGLTSINDYFNPSKMNKMFLIKSGLFVPGRSLDIILDSINQIKSIDYWKVINSLQIDRVGKTISKQLANYYADQPYDFSGLEKAIIEKMINEDSSEFNHLKDFVKTLSANGVNIIYPKPIKGIKYEMTGTPPIIGELKTKSDYESLLKQHGYVKQSLKKDSDLLITSDLTSESGKMKKAKKHGVEILTYTDVLNSLGFDLESETENQSKQSSLF